MITLLKPEAAAVKNADQLTAILLALYNAIGELRAPVAPGQAPVLKTFAMGSFAQLRSTSGDVDGNAGPRCAMLAGGTAIMDGKQGVFAWDPTSTAADDNTNVIRVASVDIGRWRRIV